jgi:anti-sigma regulatory factor (Ser/Thr protein kinase)
VPEEVLTNFVKHAHALTEEPVVELRLSASPESLPLEFRDAGGLSIRSTRPCPT